MREEKNSMLTFQFYLSISSVQTFGSMTESCLIKQRWNKYLLKLPLESNALEVAAAYMMAKVGNNLSIGWN